MRDAIARTLAWVLSVLAPRRPGRHSAEHLTEQSTSLASDSSVSPWSRPWTAPSAHDVRGVFKDERAQDLPTLQRERYYAAAFAALGVDYDHPTMPLGSVIARERVAA
ncbi:hypothetical protein ACIRU3_12910 [Streptomyces sp. NPDC101151]|uniref:hypothetical protein n=1 Tax=Streptomyces sp. NPDC101151 TaxID=3366115 RepID=UPI0037F3A31D